MAACILYNPLSSNGKGEARAREFGATLGDAQVNYYPVTEISDYAQVFASFAEDDRVILCGGDGTLNRFACDTQGLINRDIEYYASGSGNDFWRDLGREAGDAPVSITPYLKGLPSVTVNGKTSLFINGVGYGIDGYCCEIGDKIRATSDKPVNYAGIAIKGLLFHFKPRNATVTVDGKSYSFKKVWIAPVMHGRYYGGGMKMAPDQMRNNEDGTLSLVMFYGSGKLKTLMVFPSIFKGEHVKHKKHIAILTGKSFEVAFDRPTPLQIDGETVLGVEKYSVTSAVPAESEVSETVSVAE